MRWQSSARAPLPLTCVFLAAWLVSVATHDDDGHGSVVPFGLCMAVLLVTWFALPWSRRLPPIRRTISIVFLAVASIALACDSGSVFSPVILLAFANVALAWRPAVSWTLTLGVISGLFVWMLLCSHRPLATLCVETTSLTIAAVFALEMAMHVVRAEDRRAQTEALAQKKRELAIEEERRRIATSMHDSLGHYLTAIKLQSERVARLVEQSDPAKALVAANRVKELSLSAIAETRRAVRSIQDCQIDSTEPTAAWTRLVDVFEDTGLDITLIVDPALPRLSDEQAIAIYRVIQEGLTNVVRHAGASHIDVSVARSGDSISAAIEDDGVGVNRVTYGFGLAGLDLALTNLGGAINVAPASRTGLRLEATLPVGGRPR